MRRCVPKGGGVTHPPGGAPSVESLHSRADLEQVDVAERIQGAKPSPFCITSRRCPRHELGDRPFGGIVCEPSTARAGLGRTAHTINNEKPASMLPVTELFECP